ncbi:hypothetical protein J6590_053837 [Homalodisca vitripennis]|nr:hypothetical protein J6590_053837 [Homalodisca vitripennis]
MSTSLCYSRPPSTLVRATSLSSYSKRIICLTSFSYSSLDVPLRNYTTFATTNPIQWRISSDEEGQEVEHSVPRNDKPSSSVVEIRATSGSYAES